MFERILLEASRAWLNSPILQKGGILMLLAILSTETYKAADVYPWWPEWMIDNPYITKPCEGSYTYVV